MIKERENFVEWFDKKLHDVGTMTESAGQIQLTIDIIDYTELLHLAKVIHAKQTCQFAYSFSTIKTVSARDLYKEKFGEFYE